MLDHLECEYGMRVDDSNLMWLSVNTPALRVYIDCNEPGESCILTSGLQSITHLRSYTAPMVSQLKDIRTLQLRIEFDEICKFLEELRNSDTLLPDLETLEFSETWLHRELDEAVWFLSKWESTHYPALQPSIVNEDLFKEPIWNPITPVR